MKPREISVCRLSRKRLRFNWGWGGICNGYFSEHFLGINDSHFQMKRHSKNLRFSLQPGYAQFYLIRKPNQTEQ